MKISHAINISCTPEQLFPWVAEPEKAMQWQKGVRSGEILKETPGIVGTTFRETLDENGNTLEMIGEIIDYVQDQRISFQLESNIHKVDVTYSLEWDGRQSLFAMASTIRWKFPMNLMALFIGRKMKNNILQQTASEFAELKRLCETSDTP